MSDEAPEQESKTEDPSQRKLDEARKRGDVVKSQEVTTWFMLGGSALLLAMMGPSTAANLTQSLRVLLANADRFDLSGAGFSGYFWGLASGIALVALIPLAVLAACAVVANLIQHRPLLSVEPLKPKFEKISPLEGAKRLFSREALVNFAKGLAKIGIVGAAMAITLWPERDRLDTMIAAEPLTILTNFQDLALKLIGASLAAVTLIGIADYVYQRQRWWNRQKMTLQEVRDEYKQMEGSPEIKGRIRRLRTERSRRRMIAAVPEATVVIANPTHFAVALKYERSMNAPKCLAKGVDSLALKIRAIAEENGVPVIENPPLARALYASVEIDETIPVEHFKAVAQVIGYVMRLRNGGGWRATAQRN